MAEFSVDIADGKIQSLQIFRGAPCGATWKAAERLIGLSVEEALKRIGLEAQFFCSADPSGWDPISGKSPVHIAGELHHGALKKALRRKNLPRDQNDKGY